MALQLMPAGINPSPPVATLQTLHCGTEVAPLSGCFGPPCDRPASGLCHDHRYGAPFSWCCGVMDGERGRHTTGPDPVPITNTLEQGQPHFAVCWEGDFPRTLALGFFSASEAVGEKILHDKIWIA